MYVFTLYIIKIATLADELCIDSNSTDQNSYLKGPSIVKPELGVGGGKGSIPL
jgi:hypothetical protein